MRWKTENAAVGGPMYDWYPVFAWKPTECIDGYTYWLCWIQCRNVGDITEGEPLDFEFRPIPKIES